MVAIWTMLRIEMPETAWQSYDLIFFDCDSTLSSIEGIDELARFKGKEGRVGLLTNKAMDGDLDLSEVYGKRLRAIRPTRAQLKAIEERYWETMVEDAAEVIAALHFLGKQVFIISGGLIDAVKGFGRRLGVDASRIRAVELEFNELSGQWWRYHEPQAQHAQTYLDFDEGPLTVSKGKSQIIQELAGDLPGRRIMIGDGTSDLATKARVDLFIGYGGVLTRDKVKTESEIFVSANSLAAILPIAGGRAGWQTVAGSVYEALYLKGIDLVRDPMAVSFRQEKRLAELIDEFEGNQSI